MKLTLEGLVENSEVRNSAKDIMAEFDYNVEKAEDKGYKKCTCCGFYYYIENGASEFPHGDTIYLDVCNDCQDLINKGINYKDIPYHDDCLEDFEPDEDYED